MSRLFDNRTQLAMVYVPDESISTYKAATNWLQYAARIFLRNIYFLVVFGEFQEGFYQLDTTNIIGVSEIDFISCNSIIRLTTKDFAFCRNNRFLVTFNFHIIIVFLYMNDNGLILLLCTLQLVADL